MTRHIASSIVYGICNAYMLASYIIYLLPGWYEEWQVKQLDEWWTRMMKFLFITQGFVVPGLRLMEPYFYSILK